MKQELIKLPNKARIVIADRDTKVVSIAFLVSCGAEQEMRRNAGITHMLERLMRSTLVTKVAVFGGVVESKTHLENFEISVTTTSDHLKESVVAISETIFDFSPKMVSFEREKQKITQEIEKTKSNPVALVNNISRKVFFKGTGLSSDEIGTIKSISNLELEDVVEYYKKALTPENLVISIVGDISDKNMKSNNYEAKVKVSNMSVKDDEISQNKTDDEILNDLLKELDDEAYSDEDDENEDELDKDVSEEDFDTIFFNKKVKKISKTVDKLTNNNPIETIQPPKQMTANFGKVTSKKLYAKDSWDVPVIPPMDKFSTDEIVENVRTYEEIHLLIVKQFYSKTMQLKSGKNRSVAYFSPKGRIFIQKSKALNQTRFCLCFPSSPYNASGHKYAKIFEIYLSKYLRTMLSRCTSVYNMEVTNHAYKNNGYMSIYFAVDNDMAQSVYDQVYKFLIDLKTQVVTKKEFYSERDAYLTQVVLHHETMTSLARRYNKWLSLKNTLFDIDTEFETIKNLKYEDFTYVLKEILNFDAMVVGVVGKAKLNLQ